MSRPGSAPAAPAQHLALAAFLRGIELRGWVFALRQAGDEARAEDGLAHALHDFLAEAPGLPLAAWPIRFWTCLLRQPGLVCQAHEGATGLPGLPPGPRAALLLRLVAGLDITHAAEALGVAPAAYEKALHRALAAPGLDAEGVEALRRELQAQMHDAPAAQRQLLATWRDEALLSAASAASAPRPAGHPRAEALATADAQEATARRRGWPRSARIAVALASLVAVGTVVWALQGRFASAPPTPVVDHVAPPPAMTEAMAVTHPDYLLVAYQSDEAAARELPFLSWMAAATLPAPSEPMPPPVEPPARFEGLSADEQALLAAAREAWAELDLPTRTALQRQARDWLGRDAAQRSQQLGDLVAWDRLSAPEHARRRAPFAAWERLDANDREWVRQAAARVAQLPAAEQQSLRAQFAASPPDTQALWWLGPALGQELAPFSSLFAYLPESDRPALLQALRGLDADARADLGLLAPRLSEARRQALRRELLAAAPEQRAALVRDWLSR